MAYDYQGEMAHLSPSQVLGMATGILQSQQCEAHLALCPACLKNVSELQAWLRQWSGPYGDSQIRTDQCLSPDDLPALTEDQVAHAASCDRCGGLLRVAMNCDPPDSEDQALIAGLESGTPQWQRMMAERVSSGVSGKSAAPKFWLPFVASLLAVVAAGAWWIAAHRANPDRLLAEAYTASRPFEYRLPDSGYAPVQSKRSMGGPFDRPPALNAAVEEIQRRLASEENAETLTLRGRAELLENQYDGAVETLERARQLEKPSASLLAELGCAYAVRAGAERNQSDYRDALDSLQRSLLLNPLQPAAIYNSALVYEHLSLLRNAIAAWNDFLKIEKDPQWAAEARQRLRDLTERIGAHDKAMNERRQYANHPERFLAVAAARGSGFDPEPYQDVMWLNWMPKAHEDANSRNAARLVADTFATQFHDESLRSVLAAAASPEDFNRIAAVLQANLDERYGEVIASAPQLLKDLAAHHQNAARLRVSLELAYSYSRPGHFQECLDLTSQSLQELEHAEWPWLRNQTLLQHSTCAARAGHLSLAFAEAAAVRDRADSMPYLRLKAMANLVSLERTAGRYGEIWADAPVALALYWRLSGTPYRAQQLIIEMQNAAEQTGRDATALVLARANIEAAHAAGNGDTRLIEAFNRSHYSALMERAGDPVQARAQRDMAAKLYASATPGPALDATRIDATLLNAAVLTTGTEPAVIAGALRELSAAGTSRDKRVQLVAAQARGCALLVAGKAAEAAAAFREAIRLDRDIAASSTDRLAVSGIADASWRGLTQIQFLNEHNPQEALATWELYRSGAMLPQMPPGVTALVYAVLPAGTAIWRVDSTGVQGHLANTGLAKDGEEFLRLVASAESDRRSLDAVAARLYRSLVSDVAAGVSQGSIMAIEADGWTATLPFGALLSENGYLAAQHPVVMIDALNDAVSRDSRAFTPAQGALIISVPAPRAPSGNPLPILETATAEAAYLRGLVPKAKLLEGEQATIANIQRGLSESSLVHFAGHGWSNAGNGGLLLASEWLTADDLANQDWRSCRLAVLSACLTATGEGRGPVNSRSLVRALRSAGAKRVIAARWSVDAAATQALMEAFYQSLFGGASPARALASAETRVASIGKWSHPAYWAGFDVYGEI